MRVPAANSDIKIQLKANDCTKTNRIASSPKIKFVARMFEFINDEAFRLIGRT
jgi:hypothetical protein